MQINEIILEAVDNSGLKRVGQVIKQNPIGVGSLLAALYTIYSKSKNKEDKIEAALNAFPEAVKKALIFLASAHGLKSILLGNIDMTNAGKVLRDSTSQPNFQSNSSNNNQPNNSSNNQSTTIRSQHRVPKYRYVNGKLVQS